MWPSFGRFFLLNMLLQVFCKLCISKDLGRNLCDITSPVTGHSCNSCAFSFYSKSGKQWKYVWLSLLRQLETVRTMNQWLLPLSPSLLHKTLWKSSGLRRAQQRQIVFYLCDGYKTKKPLKIFKLLPLTVKTSLNQTKVSPVPFKLHFLLSFLLQMNILITLYFLLDSVLSQGVHHRALGCSWLWEELDWS